ncbi:hypothetical protein AAFH49_04065 [Hymenobacter segetis]|uniref:Lipoprotein n=2 Tax=Hymenobacter segetis TaxID=2025509 RepID=A0ABU9LRY3_9BACT
MRYWSAAVAMCSLLFSACVPQAFEQVDFRSHLTQEERKSLAGGKTVDKVHTSYWRFKPRQIYWQGPLLAKQDSSGKFQFTPYGTWIGYYKSGAVRDTTVYSAKAKAWRVRFYQENGSLYVVTNTVPKTVNGRPFSESQDIQFRNGNKLDTVLIRRWGCFQNDGKTVLDEQIEFDASGRRKAVMKIK